MSCDPLFRHDPCNTGMTGVTTAVTVIDFTRSIMTLDFTLVTTMALKTFTCQVRSRQHKILYDPL